MDRFKFRAWGPHLKHMWNWEDLNMTVGIGIFFSETGKIIMQSTGLMDKNGKLIYEGDVVSEGNFAGGTSGPIEYDQEFCKFVYRTRTASIGLYLFCGEIIGNIYENPELLEESG